jgi:MFS family permease
MLSNIPAGILADRVSNKRLLTIGAVLSLLASLVFAIAKDYPIALASRLALGISGALMYVPAVRYVVISFPKERRASAMGVVEVGAGVGMFLSLTLLPLLKGIRPSKSFPHVAGFCRIGSRRCPLGIIKGGAPRESILPSETYYLRRQPLSLVSPHLFLLRHACSLFCFGMASNFSPD